MGIVDLHCDTISMLGDNNQGIYKNECHFDLVRAQKAGIMVQFFALFTLPTDCNTALRSTMRLAAKFYAELECNQSYLYLVKKPEDIAAEQNDKIGCLLHLEGAEAIGNDLDILYMLYRLGIRSIGLTWNYRNLLADGIGEESAGGLSAKGREVIQAMEQMGIILDLAHISEKAFFEALECYHKPVMVTHANVRALCSAPRNLTDQQLRALAEHGGIIGLNQVSRFVKAGTPSVDDFIDHIVYVAELIGVEHVALGSDFDGADNIVLSGVQGYQLLPAKLAARGFSPTEIDKILGQNAIAIINNVLEKNKESE